MKKENIVDGNIILAKMQNEAGRDLSGSFTVTLETVRSWVKEAEIKAEYSFVKDVRPIDANKLKESIIDAIHSLYISTKGGQEDDENYGEVLASFCEKIDKSPTLDYAPVFYAKWIKRYFLEDPEQFCPSPYYECSRCGKEIYPCELLGGVIEQYPYCNCGAKMSLGDDDE